MWMKMRLQVGKPRTSDGMRQKIICIVFMALLLGRSSALIMRTGFADFLNTVTDTELDDFMIELFLDLDNIVRSDSFLWPGIVTSLRYDLSNGYSMIIVLMHWNRDTCNLGRGGEAQHPLIQIAGSELRSLMFTWLIPSIRSLVDHYMGYGFALHERVSLLYFPLLTDSIEEDQLSNHDLSKSKTQMDLLRDTKTMISYWRVKDSQASLPRSSNDDTFPFTHPNTNESGGFSVSNFTLPAAYSNSSNNKATGDRKFPIDPNGDCDVISIQLISAVGPDYDDQSGHGVHVLNPTDKVFSPNTRFNLVMQIDCNLVLYDNDQGVSLWSSKTQNLGTTCIAYLSSYGELIVFDQTKSEVLFRTSSWCTDNGGKCYTNTALEVQNDGNMVFYDLVDYKVLYASNTVVCEGGC